MATAGECLGIVGVGLIGGSVGLAARRTGRFATIVGVGRDPRSLERARSLGCIDEGTTDLISAARRIDVMVFCTPVDRIADQVLAAAPHCRPRTLITDAGSTKAAIVAAVEQNLPSQVHFVGAHPLAGSEKCGPEHARADLFDNRLTVLTPTTRTKPEAVAGGRGFWAGLGCRVATMGPDEHDRALALTSHLPHLVAAALAGTLPDGLRDLCATGFRDTTRLAAGDPKLWAAIFLQNRMNVIDAAGAMQDRFGELKRAVIDADVGRLVQLLTEARQVRDDLGS